VTGAVWQSFFASVLTSSTSQSFGRWNLEQGPSNSLSLSESLLFFIETSIFWCWHFLDPGVLDPFLLYALVCRLLLLFHDSEPLTANQRAGVRASTSFTFCFLLAFQVSFLGLGIFPAIYDSKASSPNILCILSQTCQAHQRIPAAFQVCSFLTPSPF
jgi:uncharacterized membrane protein YGL010W